MTKKTIQKPENWQDFENLCKKLWGEIFEIPNEIKKNGRSGQSQQGVDIVGIPKGENYYVGIQCKGKDEYAQKKLTEKEVDREIQLAKEFKPKLGKFIIATTSNKDASIEEYVRFKDQENDFKILLFCWEDITDLIEENRNTHDYYVKNLMHKSNFGFSILYNQLESNITLKPLLARKSITHFYTEKTTQQVLREAQASLDAINIPTPLIPDLSVFPFNQPRYMNESWISFDIVLLNSGASVLEDWKFQLKFTKGVRRLSDESSGGYMTPNISLVNIDKDNPRYIDTDSKTVYYKPVKESSLVQNDNKWFPVSILIEIEAKEIEFEWELLARDYSIEGTERVSVTPNYQDIQERKEVFSEEEVRVETSIEHLVLKT
jgi:hypothetical protein